MTTYTLAIAPRIDAELSKIVNERVFESLPGAIQVEARTGSRFALQMNWVRGLADYRTMSALLGQLQGKVHRLLVPMSKIGYTKLGVGGGTPLLSGAHSAGTRTINLKGLPANTTGILQPGDHFQIGNQLVEATTILSSTGSPNTRGSLTIWPELHKAYADGASVNYATPGGIFILMDEGPHLWDGAVGSLSGNFMQDVTA